MEFIYLFILFYLKTPSVIDSDSLNSISFGALQKIYSTILGLDNKLLNELRDIDDIHL